LGIGCAAAIAKEQQLAAGTNRFDASADQFCERVRQRRLRTTGNIVMFGKLRFEKRC
jgi:hypothetical protein